VRADQIVDYLALMGDAIDNIPGIPKCGPKTAAKWLAEYGSLDGVIANADKVGGKIGEALREALPRLPLNRVLTTIKTDVALDQAPAELHLRERDVEALRALYTRYGFNQALKELDGSASSNASPPALEKEPGIARGNGFVAPGASASQAGLDPVLSAPGEYECVLGMAQLDAWVARLQAAGEFAFDTETDSLDPMRANLVGISLSVEPGKACYIPIAHEAIPGVAAQLPRDVVLDALRPLLADPAKKKLGQHGKYDLHVLRRHGVDVHGYADDTMLESFVLNAGIARHDMDSLAQRHLGYQTVKYEDVAGKGAKQIGVRPGRAGRCHPLCGGRRRHHLAPASRDAAQAAGRAGVAVCVPRHRDAAGAGAGTGRSQWGDGSMPRNCAGSPPTCRGGCWPRNRRPPNWPGAASTWIRPSSSARCCSTSSSCRRW
jgi:DNA polymerase-1